MLIYVLANHFEDAKLTKKEIKNTKKAYKNYKAQLEAYGLGSYLNYTVESAIHAEQFDKVMNYLLEYTVDENTNAITYAHVKYDFNSPKAENE